MVISVDILDKHVLKGSRRLELFARNLHPNWTSWGNEVCTCAVGPVLHHTLTSILLYLYTSGIP